jgi:hypothetical protein
VLKQLRFLKKKKYISLLFLFAISLMLAHGIVPHHHDDVSCLLNSCGNYNVSSGESREHSKAPWNCRAYSDVVFFERQLLGKSRTVVSNYLPFAFNQVTYTFMLPDPDSPCSVYNGEQVIYNPFIPSSPLRAPPTLA